VFDDMLHLYGRVNECDR